MGAKRIAISQAKLAKKKKYKVELQIAYGYRTGQDS